MLSDRRCYVRLKLDLKATGPVMGRNVGLDGHGARTHADACLAYLPFGLLPYMHELE